MSLTIVGTGIRLIGQTTKDAIAYIKAADKLLYLANNSATEEWLHSLNPTGESLYGCYGEGKRRDLSYEEMVQRILEPVRQRLEVCVALYGHPGVFVYPSHEAIRRARLEGFEAQMLPGISTEDCLFADVGIDPGPVGCQSFEATDFLLHRRIFDPTSHLILWQIGCIGDATYRAEGYDLTPLHLLTEVLMECYGESHEVVLYKSSPYPICRSFIGRIPLTRLPSARVDSMSTLYVPPLNARPVDPEMRLRLGLAKAPEAPAASA